MITELELFYMEKEEPVASCLWSLRDFILKADPRISESWTHKMPMFRYDGKLFCYLWVDKKTYRPYVGMYDGLDLNHPLLELGTRNKMKTLDIDPAADLPIDTLNEIFTEAISLRQ